MVRSPHWGGDEIFASGAHLRRLRRTLERARRFYTRRPPKTRRVLFFAFGIAYRGDAWRRVRVVEVELIRRSAAVVTREGADGSQASLGEPDRWVSKAKEVAGPSGYGGMRRRGNIGRTRTVLSSRTGNRKDGRLEQPLRRTGRVSHDFNDRSSDGNLLYP